MLPKMRSDRCHLLLVTMLAAQIQFTSAGMCNVLFRGAVGNDKTDDTASIQHTIDECHQRYPVGATVLLPKGTFRITASIALASNMTLQLAPNSTLFSDRPPNMPTLQNPRCPILYWKNGPTAILCGTNLTNIAVVGDSPKTSVIDGGG